MPTPVSTVDAGGGSYGGYGGTLPLDVFDIDVGGTKREFIVGLPTGYDSHRTYPLVFAWHGLGGSDMQVAQGGTLSPNVNPFGGFYGLRYLSNQSNQPMIFVAAQGLDANDAGAGWPNTNDEDIAFTKAMLGWLESSYCVDTARVYSVGMSYGGIMSNTVGCEMGDVVRAIAPMSGMGPNTYFGAAACKGEVAVWLAHGTQDTTVPIANGEQSLAHWVGANHCQDASAPLDVPSDAGAPPTCVAYQGCDPGHPVDWCTFDAGHTVVPFESYGIWQFLQQF